jgi:hypothetical protein
MNRNSARILFFKLLSRISAPQDQTMLTRVFALITLAAILTIGYCSVMPEYSSILLTDVKALTLYKEKYTSARRVEPILQV